MGRLPSTTATRMLAPLLGVIATGVGVSLVTAGAFVAVFEAAGLTSPAAGWLVDRVGARRALATSLVVFAAAASAAAAAPNGWVFAGALLALGLGANVYEAGAVVWIASASSFRERAAWMGRYELSWAGGLLIGVPVAGVLSLASWRLAFAALAALALLARVALAPRLGRGGGPAPRRVRANAGISVGSSVAVTRADGERSGGARSQTIAVFVSFGVLCGASQMVIVAYGVWLEDRFGFSSATIGVVAFVLGTGDLVANLAALRFTDRLGKARSAVLGTVVLVLSALVLAAVARHLVPGVLFLLALIIGFEFALLSSKPLLTELGWQRRGVGVGVGFAAASASRAGAAVIGTALYSRYGMAAPAIAAAVCGAIAGVVFHFAVAEPTYELAG